MSNVADSMFSSLSEHDLIFVETQLTQNAGPSDEELQAIFVRHGLSVAQAAQAIRYRDLYQQYTFHKDHTPIRKNKHALRFNRDRMEYELVPC